MPKAVFRLIQGILVAAALGNASLAQGPSGNPRQSAARQDSQTRSSTSKAADSWYVQDPTTGKTYRQTLIRENVTGQSLETRAVVRNVYVPRTVYQNVSVNNVSYVPQTTYKMESRVRGTWNPFRPSVNTWESVPTTQWVAKPTPSTRVAPQTVWTAQQQTIYEQVPVERTQVRERIVSVEVQSAPGLAGLQPKQTQVAPPTALANASLSRSHSRWRPTGNVPDYTALAAAANPNANSPGRGATGCSSPPAILPQDNRQPSLTASSNSRLGRDTLQSGMNATVLR